MFKISVTVKPNSKIESLQLNDSILIAKISVPPKNGKANKRLVELLAEKIGVSKSQITILKGRTSRHKTVQINTNKQTFNDFLANLPKLPTQETLI